jgi:hypothetical protein
MCCRFLGPNLGPQLPETDRDCPECYSAQSRSIRWHSVERAGFAYAISKTGGHRQVRQRHRGGVMLSKLLAGWVAQHVTSGLSRYELLTDFVEWAAIVVRNCDDVALSPAHAWYFFV